MKSGDLVGIFVLLILAFFGWKLWPQIRLALMGGPNLGSPEDQLLGPINYQGISPVPLQNLDGLPSYAYDDPNAPWNSGTDANSYVPIGS